MDDLERRIIHLEHTSHTDRQLTQVHIAALYQRLQAAEQINLNPFRSIPLGSIFRIALALLLPIIVWLVTGDMAKALRAVMR